MNPDFALLIDVLTHSRTWRLIQSSGRVGGAALGQGLSSDGKTDGFGYGAIAPSWEQVPEWCTQPSAGDPVDYSNRFGSGYSVETMAGLFMKVHIGPKRLS